MPSREPRLLYQVRATLRRKHYHYRTEKLYLNWIRCFIRVAQELLGHKDVRTTEGVPDPLLPCPRRRDAA